MILMLLVLTVIFIGIEWYPLWALLARTVWSFLYDLSWRARVSFWHVWGTMTHRHLVSEGGFASHADPYGLKKICLVCCKDFGPADFDSTNLCVPGEPDPDGIGGRKSIWR